MQNEITNGSFDIYFNNFNPEFTSKKSIMKIIEENQVYYLFI